MGVLGLDDTATVAFHAMAESHDAKQWAKCVAVGDAWLEARGELPALCCVWYAQSLMGVGRYNDAVPWARVAAENMPSGDVGEQIAQCAARSTYAQALGRIGHFRKARQVLKQMVAPCIEHAETKEKQGHILLATTDKWRVGWALHEQRESNATIPDGLTRWDGVSKGTVGVLHEQGIGDAVLFARWLPWVARQSGKPVVWFGPEKVLGRWMADLPNVVVGDRREGHQTPVDVAVWSMSLPFVAGCHRKALIPAPVAPYELVQKRSRYEPVPGQLRVGVCWKGAATGWHDFERSLGYDEFSPIVEPLEGVEFVNLCHDAAVPNDAPFVQRSYADIYDCGEVIAGLDVVVSVDTAVVHLAGSLKVPTLAIVPTVPDWRYAWPVGTTSPFYHSVTVCRRQRGDDRTVITDARRTLEAYVAHLNRKAA